MCLGVCSCVYSLRAYTRYARVCLGSCSMNFSFSTKKTSVSVNPFGEDEEVPKETTAAPTDYLKARMDALRSVAGAARVAGPVGGPVAGPVTGPAVGPLGSVSNPTISTKPDVSNPGLVMMGDPTIGVSKHINRMKETAQVNEKFKTLLAVKTADREKRNLQVEFGSAPEEFITSAYRKQKEASLALEKELEQSESGGDVAKFYKQMLQSGNYARSNFTQVEDVAQKAELPDLIPPVSVAVADVEKVLSKIVPESATQVVKEIKSRAKTDALKIVEQIANQFEESEDPEERRKLAKQKYLERKRAKLE